MSPGPRSPRPLWDEDSLFGGCHRTSCAIMCATVKCAWHVLTVPHVRMSYGKLIDAAADTSSVRGFSHDFYRYPARFSPQFVRAVIEEFSEPNSLVLDPFMGGGTTMVEALALGRQAAGCDINSLAVFLAKVKTSPLKAHEARAVESWFVSLDKKLNYRYPRAKLACVLEDCRASNLNVPTARALKKALAIILANLDSLPNGRTKAFARCVALKTGQWALDSNKKHVSLTEFRLRLLENCHSMLMGLQSFARSYYSHKLGRHAKAITLCPADQVGQLRPFQVPCEKRADLVVTSPPYPAVHVLYHRWQILGRRESPAPYWLTNSSDGHGASYFTIVHRA